MKADCKQFMGLLFAARDYAHRQHLATNSYAQHVALGGFYDGIIDLADTFAEAYMGREGKRIGDFASVAVPAGEPDKVLRRILDVIEDIRDFVPAKDTALNNIIDEIVDLFLKTLFLLTLK